ncbi:pseudaminic acid synthase [Oceanospirillum linum]|uniref:Pseudaminic acid synthase n=1 Tax=Oceanospirillum linum TaxID=966 RepID=A0A1T1HFJ3_OCELI|nr:pseudaminic acid synthase [Oceanospirillum linum]OOV88586.1 pseudaminic acid synthase [Oceanospirillum linum]SEF61806.1 N-acetylneuraminate synthase [Oleiphilus messinensis]SMP07303.1 N-acetylneuraminate synthase [Oceanospirillum linum]
MSYIEIDDRKIGQGYQPYILAELSANHNGVLQKALDTITQAKNCGADAIKLQTYSADTMTIDCDSEEFMIKGGLWGGCKLYDLYKWAQTPFEWHKAMFDHARNIGITCFSTPFDETAVDLLEDMNVPAYKVASFEATDLPLIRYIASTKKPMIMSTGMANFEEISEMVATAKEAGCQDLIVLHCLSSYPAPVEQSNLLTIPDLRKKLNVQIGLSDHTITNTASIAATALGATLIEKHFILDRNDKGPDSEFSIEPAELTSLVEQTKDAWLSLGEAGYERKPAEEANVKFRRSVYFVKDMQAGEPITPDSIRRIRPGFGLAPKYEQDIIGKHLKIAVTRGTPTSWDLFDE